MSAIGLFTQANPRARAELGIKGKIMVNFHSLSSDSSKQLMEH